MILFAIFRSHEQLSFDWRSQCPKLLVLRVATAAVIPGASKPERIAEDYAALNTTIPDDFWHEMRDHHLVAANAPLPIDR